MVQHLLKEITGNPVPIEAFVDSRTVFEVVEKQGRTYEKRLQIDINSLPKSYDSGEPRKPAWIRGTSKPAELLTKIAMKDENPLTDLIMTKKVSIQPLGWATITEESGSGQHRPITVGRTRPVTRKSKTYRVSITNWRMHVCVKIRHYPRIIWKWRRSRDRTEDRGNDPKPQC